MNENLAKVNGLPGAFWTSGRTVKRYWWAVKLPGELKRRHIPLTPEGSEYATDDPGVAVEVARIILADAEAKAAASGPRHGFDGTIRHLCSLYLAYARQYYRAPDGEATGQVSKVSMMVHKLCQTHGGHRAERFDQLCLKDWRQEMITKVNPDTEKALCRTTINGLADVIRMMFKWAVSEKLVPGSVHYALTTVRNLAEGRGMGARESKRVTDVDPESVRRTLPFLGPVPRAMAELQLLTGMRSSELCVMRAIDIDTSGDVWLYKPPRHKNAWRRHAKVVPLVGSARKIVERFLPGRPLDSYLFAPKDSETMRLHETCKSKAKVESRRKYRPRYDRETYRSAVTRAIHQGNRALKRKAEDQARKEGRDPAKAKWLPIPHWHPHQIRHTVGTILRNTVGLDHARAMLGHKTLGMTDTYTRIDQRIAIEAARKLA